MLLKSMKELLLGSKMNKMKMEITFNPEIMWELNFKIWVLQHSVRFTHDRYTTSNVYTTINKLLSEYASTNPYT